MERFTFKCPLRHITIYQHLHDFLIPWNEKTRWDWAKEGLEEDELL